MDNYKYCLLRMVNAEANNNKDYEMVQTSEQTFEVHYGRVKSSKMVKAYDMSVWDSIYEQKIQKGYVDVTDTINTVIQEQSLYKEIENDEIRHLIDELLRYANEYVEKTYKISKQEVTQQMFTIANGYIQELSVCKDNISLHSFNEVLQKLFTIIPRKMEDVSDYLAFRPDEMAGIIQREQKNLSVLRSVCEISCKDICPETNKETILESFGLSVNEVTEKELSNITQKLGSESSGRLKKAYRIMQKDLEERHNKYLEENEMTEENEILLWHGTRNECIWPIMKTGLLLNPGVAINGKMFGQGLYFAPRAKKSLGYTSLKGSVWARGTSNRGFMFVMNVAYKDPEHVKDWQSWMGHLNEKEIKKRGHDALYAHAGGSLVNDEIIVYNEAACVPKYLLVLE